MDLLKFWAYIELELNLGGGSVISKVIHDSGVKFQMFRIHIVKSRISICDHDYYYYYLLVLMALVLLLPWHVVSMSEKYLSWLTQIRSNQSISSFGDLLHVSAINYPPIYMKMTTDDGNNYREKINRIGLG